jgi:hypothetical protein
MQNAEFDYLEGQRRKFQGMERAASYPFDEPVHRARLIAIMLAKQHGSVTADDVYDYLAERLPDVLDGIQPKAWGSVTRHPRLRATGQYRQSNRISRHTGVQAVWEYNAQT